MSAGTLLNGLLLGGMYAIIALGLSLVFGVLRLINLAHGELVVGGAYLALVLYQDVGWNPWVSIPVVVVAAGVVGYVVQRYLLTGLMLKGPEPALVGTFGLSLLGQAAFAEAFTSNTRSLPSSLGTTGLHVGGAEVSAAYVLAFGAAVFLCVAVHLFLDRTRPGAVIRAAASDPRTADLLGSDVRRTYGLVFALAAGLAAIGGILYGVTFSFTPTTGPALLLIGFAVVVLGGVGNVFGTLLAGLAIGLVQAVGIAYFGGGYSNFIVYVVFFLVLVIRPTGLFGRAAA